MMIGIIGVGNIGSRVAKCISKKHNVITYDIVQKKSESISSNRIRVAKSNIEISRKCKIIFLSLPGPKEVQDTIIGNAGIINNLSPGSIVVDLTTNSPKTIVEIGEHLKTQDINFIEMPVSGGIMAAETGTLSAFVGGELQTYEEILDILNLFSKERTHYGSLGKASVAKLLNNRIGIQCSFLVIESLLIGAKYGIDPHMLLDSIQASSGSNVQVPRVRDVLFSSGFKNGFPARLAVKDCQLISEVELSVDACSGATKDAMRFYENTVIDGYKEEDFAIVVKTLQKHFNQYLQYLK